MLGNSVDDQQLSCLWMNDYLLSVSLSGEKVLVFLCTDIAESYGCSANSDIFSLFIVHPIFDCIVKAHQFAEKSVHNS